LNNYILRRFITKIFLWKAQRKIKKDEKWIIKMAAKIREKNSYGEGIPSGKSTNMESQSVCKGNPNLRTNYSETMEPSRGSRTYPSVRIIEGK
jgi:hypothetical protein